MTTSANSADRLATRIFTGLLAGLFLGMTCVEIFMPRNLLKDVVEFQLLPLILCGMLVDTTGTPLRSLLEFAGKLRTLIVHHARTRVPRNWFLLPLLLTACATPRGERWLQTTAGPLPAERAGVILTHEHIFTDLRGPDAAGYGLADANDVVRIMKPLLAEVKAQGVDVLVECTPIGVGRNVPVIARLARETGLHIVVPTGVYGRANFAPQAYRAMTEAQLTQWMVREIRHDIEGTGIKAGFIKIATGGKQLTPLEEKFLQAAVKAAAQTGVAIASHTPSGAAAVQQVDIIDQMGLAVRFIWVHAQAESDLHYHQQLAARGIYIELDSIGASPAEDDQLITTIHQLITAGNGDRILLSHDAGWYNPGQLNGGKQRPYTYLLGTFVPKLRNSGLDEKTIRMLTSENPRRAFGLARR